MKTHGMTNTKLFSKWQTMKQRCYDKNKQHYEYYGGRGIIVCKEWKEDFLCFHDWAMQNGYKDELTLDRIDADGNYEPSNCRWVDLKTQANNKRNNRKFSYKGVMYTIAELSEKFCIPYSSLYYRLTHGWNVEKAVSLQVVLGRNQYGEI